MFSNMMLMLSVITLGIVIGACAGLFLLIVDNIMIERVYKNRNIDRAV